MRLYGYRSQELRKPVSTGNVFLFSFSLSLSELGACRLARGITRLAAKVGRVSSNSSTAWLFKLKIQDQIL
jgi:hypothetical protein